MIVPQKKEITPVKGIDTREPQPDGSASAIQNMVFNSEIASWSNDLGYERYFPGRTNFLPFANTPVDSLYNFERHNGAQCFLLLEQGGTLSYLQGSNNGSLTTLKTARTVPGSGEPGSFYNVFSRYVVITNGLDSPLKYRGYTEIQNLGWDRKPNPPSVAALAPNPNSNAQRLQSQPATSTLNTVATTLFPTSYGNGDTQGLGSTTAAQFNKFKWKIALVNESGSVSPISSESESLSWTSTADALGNVNRMVPQLTNLPTGGKGTVGKYLYRTKNLEQVDDGNFYFEAYIPHNQDVSYFSEKSDDELGSLAPNDADSITFPAAQCKYSATFKGCLFLDGGSSDGTKLFRSEPLQCDTFKASTLLDLGTRKGGNITGLYTYYNQILVFRDSAIDMVRGDPLNGFQVVPFAQGIGTKSPHTITFVPGLGVLFLGNDGVYAISGGLDGGSTLSIQNISNGIGTLLEKRVIDIIGKACAAYSPKMKEWQCYFPAFGVDNSVMGIVYHVDGGYWSEREGFQVGCVTTDFNGNVIFGNIEGQKYSPVIAGLQNETGLFVVSRRHAGGTLWASTGGPNPVFSLVDAPPLPAQWRSKWHDFGAPFIKKFVKYVYIYGATRGSQKISLSYYKDHNWQSEIIHPDQEWQTDDNANQPVYSATITDDAAILDTDRWQDKTITPIRFDIANKALTDFAFEILSDKPFEFTGYSVEFETNGTQTIGGKR
jgi:hypothetical protein